MANYSIRNTRNQIIANVADTTLDQTTSVYLVGRNYSGYGIYVNDNAVRLMENFAANSAPSNPLEGQLWYDTSVDRMKWWEGSTWKQIQSTEVSTNNPTGVGRRDGDMWYDTTNEQLYVWNASPSGNAGSARWDLIGPQFNATTPKTGTFVEIIYDNSNAPHYVLVSYANGSVVTILNPDAEFTPAAGNTRVGFDTIKRGLQMTANVGSYTFAGTANNSISLANIDSSLYIRSNAAAAFANNAPITVTSNAGITIGESTTANIHVEYVTGDLSIRNFANGGNINLFTETAGGAQVLGVHVNGDGFVTLANDPTANLHAVTKRYVDVRVAATNQNVESNATLLTSYITAANASIVSLESNAASQQAQIALRATIDSPFFTGNPQAPTPTVNDSSTSIATTAFATTAVNNLSTNVFANTGAIAASLVFLAPLANPALTGTPTAPTAAAGTNTTQIATTAFVKTAVDALDSNVASALSFKAPLADPALTGTPTAPTASAGTNTTQLATTAFVFEANAGVLARVLSNTAAIANNLATNYAPLASPALTGTPTAPTAAQNANTTVIATTAFVTRAVNALDSNVQTALSAKAPLASPALTGTPTAPNAAVNANSTQIATTAFVQTAIAQLFSNTFANTGSIANSLNDYARVLNPTLTGVPRAPTATIGNSSTMIATTAFVQTAVNALDSNVTTALALKSPLASPTFTGTPVAPTANASADSTQLATTAFVHNVLPYGSIIIWYGSTASIPYGWRLCNGSNGTPDLRNRFVVGAGNTYAVNDTGGQTTANINSNVAGAHDHGGSTGNHTLTLAQIPSHNHPLPQAVQAVADGSVVNSHKNANPVASVSSTSNVGGGQAHSHTITSAGNHSHSFTGEWLPPYYALCYIMKVI